MNREQIQELRKLGYETGKKITALVAELEQKTNLPVKVEYSEIGKCYVVLIEIHSNNPPRASGDTDRSDGKV